MLLKHNYHAIMGTIQKLIKQQTLTDDFLCNNRFAIELCENVHVHYRDIRLEFTPTEFCHILRLLKSVDENAVKSFNYGPEAFLTICHDTTLGPCTEHNNRYQIEEQAEGHFHTHYRNLRIETKKAIPLL